MLVSRNRTLPAFALRPLALLAFALGLLPVSAAAMQDPQAPAPQVTAGPPALAVSATPVAALLPLDAYCGAKPTAGNRSWTSTCHLGDTLTVEFRDLAKWMSNDTNHLADMTLVLNGRVMRGMAPRGPNDDYTGLQFDLVRLEGDGEDAAANRAAWSLLMPQLRAKEPLQVAVASGGLPPFVLLPQNSYKLKFEVYPSYTVFVVAFLGLLVLGFVLLARNSDILRDAPSTDPKNKASYSLARCQMAWWFFLVAASFSYIWLMLGNYDSLTAGVLILTGISASTGLASAVIDSNKQEQRKALEDEKVDVSSRIDALVAAIPSVPAAAATALVADQFHRRARLDQIASALGNLPRPAGQSNGFLNDILRDETGISFHRFQMAAWTIILGIVFIASVYSHLTMPDFSATLLGLMGISSGTYIGFKIPDPAKP